MAGEFSFGAPVQIVTAQAIATAGDYTSAEVSQEGKLGSEVSVIIAYGATATEGVKAYILGKDGAGVFEAEADNPWGLSLPYTVSTTHRRVFRVPPSVSAFKLLLTNDSGATVTANAYVKPITAAA